MFSSAFSFCLVAMFVLTTEAVSITHHQNDMNQEADETTPLKTTWDSMRSSVGNAQESIKNAPSAPIQDISAIREMISNGNWDRFTPPPISNPDCHVEVQMVQKVPGRCIRLGARQVPACQTQNWVAFNSEDCSQM